ncbi:BON domain-containing protein [Magnetospirillum gryphiswaldense]|uniref:Periplasmic or secreted lipoprotein n=1 Tax=Magnetospirillum gryphiswaldense TaxID=55518 RepID=A4TW20_9PROT|nr:BON domain-containing protein [Magnetospirillum gryphiswaldense]AVM75479.1 Osmotically-inducible protein Y precursor [Magnetospirillum gryphiswaldense MSR-1]AVM79382.1 Osmotically-inducible protein Y precursor [Magnetospirillum gryphiswaldense]CAM74827.1 periplasmic or secreted lipoprotein [Magnetospirillum gryphiswaldense MSR-1]
MTIHRSLALIAMLAAAPSLSGCVGMVIGAGATAGVAASEERGLEGATQDARIRVEINEAWFRHNVDMYSKVTLAISEGRVLLTGTVPTEQVREDAVRLTWQVAGVREVYNELLVSESSGVIDGARDLRIQQEIKSRMLFDKQISNINYTVDVTDGTVYLLGIAQSDTELNRVIGHAREVSAVKNVITYVRLKNDPRRHGG